MRRILAMVLAMMMILSGTCVLAEQTEPVQLVFSTMDEGTGAYTYAAALKEIIEDALPAGSTVELVSDSRGAVDAPEQLEDGECDLIMSNAGPAAWYNEANPDSSVRTLCGGLGYDFINVMMTEKYAAEQGIFSLEELVEKKLPVRIAVKQEGSLGASAAEKVLIALGVSFADIEEWGGEVIRTDSAGILAAIENGEADLTIDHIAAWQENTTALCESVQMRFVQLGSETLSRLETYGFSPIDIEPNMFKWQSEGIATVGSQQVVLVSADMDNELAYSLAKAICESDTQLAEVSDALERFVAMDAGMESLCGAQVHAGAAQYYWEMGYAAK